MSPTQCPINFNDASFSAWLTLLDDRTSKSFLVAVTTQADAPDSSRSEVHPNLSAGSESARLLFAVGGPATCRHG